MFPDVTFVNLVYGALHTKNHTNYPDFSPSSSFFLLSFSKHVLLYEEKPPLS